MRLAYEQPSLIISAEPPPRAELAAARRAAHSLAAQGLARVLHVPGADADDNAGDRSYLVLTKPNVIMNDVRLRGLGVAGSDPAGRKSPHNHAQTVRNVRRSLKNAAAGARLIQAEGLDTKSAADVATTLPMPSQSFTGFSAASIDGSGAIKDGQKGLQPAHSILSAGTASVDPT